MKRNTVLILIAAALAIAAGLSLYSKTEPTTAPVAATQPAAPAAPDMAVGDSCSADCGVGVSAAITCAAGETPKCDCAVTPNAQCLPAAAATP